MSEDRGYSRAVGGGSNSGSTAVSVLAFVALLAAVFIGLAWYVTRLQGGGVSAATSGIDVERGQALFWGDGSCHTCHSIGAEGSAVRCPNLGVQGEVFRSPIGLRAASRRADQGYSAIEYLAESIYDPNAFVVDGYPRDLMKPMHRPPVALDDDEIASVIMYLLVASGVDVDDSTVAAIQVAQSGWVGTAGDAEVTGPGFEFPPGDADAGLDAFTEMSCFLCHRVKGGVLDLDGAPPGGVGPDLSSIGAIQTPIYLAESILAPSRLVVADPPGVEAGADGSYQDEEGNSRMPEFHDAMTLRQLQDIVAFLATLKGEQSNSELYPGG